MTLSELREQAKALADEITSLEQIPDEDITSEQEVRFTECMEEAVKVAEAITAAVEEERAAALAVIRAEGAASPRIETTDETVEEDEQKPAKSAIRSRTAKRNPYDFSRSELRWSAGMIDVNNPASIPPSVATEFRSRAHDAVEQAPEYVTDEHREQAARKIDRDKDGLVAAHYLRYGSPEYTDAFFHYLRTTEKRTALSTTGQNGGYLIPFFLDPTVILTNTGSVNQFRQIADVVSITSNVWHGVSSAGVTAEWTAEATQAADASPTFSQPTITTHKADAYVQASFEVTQDSSIAMELPGLFADAKARLEATAFATGAGDGSNQPWGIVTRLATASSTQVQTNGAFGLIDVYALSNALPARYQDNCSWVAHWSIYNLIRQFATGSVTASAFWADMNPGTPNQLLGRPTYTSSAMKAAPLSSVTASSDNILILGDFRQGFKIVDRIGMEVVYNPLVISTNANRPTGEVGWYAYWRTGADVVNLDAFRLLVA